MACSDGKSQVFTLVSGDGASFVVDKAAVMQLQIVAHAMEDINPEQGDVEFPIPNVDSKTLEKVVSWCNQHVQDVGIDREAMKSREEKFVGELTLDELYDLLVASNYLVGNDLLSRLCERFSEIIRGKMPDEVRALFGIGNDFSEEEQAEIERRNSWAWTTSDGDLSLEPKVFEDKSCKQTEDQTSEYGEEDQLEEDEIIRERITRLRCPIFLIRPYK